MKRLAAFILGLVLASPAWAQSVAPFPQTVPDNTVVGRLGSGSGQGPTEAIPFIQFTQKIFTGCSVLGTIPISTGSSSQMACRLLVGSDLPNPSAVTLGGTFALPSGTNQVLCGISLAGAPTPCGISGTSGSNPAVVLLQSNPNLLGSLFVNSFQFLTSDQTYNYLCNYGVSSSCGNGVASVQWNASNFIIANPTDISLTIGGTTIANVTSGGITTQSASGLFINNAGNTFSDHLSVGAVTGNHTILLPDFGGTVMTTSTAASTITGITEQGSTLISVNTISSATNYQDTTSITSACDDYEVLVTDLIPVTNNVNPEILIHSNGSFPATSYVNASGGATTFFDVTASAGNLGNVDGASFVFSLYGVNSSVHKKLKAFGDYLTTTPTVLGINASGTWTGGTTAIDGFEILMSSGNISSGKVKVYCRRPAL